MLRARFRAATIAVGTVAGIVAVTAGLTVAQAGTGLRSAVGPSGSISGSCTGGPIDGSCNVTASQPSSAGSTSSSAASGGAPVCRESFTQTVVACEDPQLGEFNGVGCYLKFDDPQPPASDPVWLGAEPGTDCAVFLATCFVIAGGQLQLEPVGITWQAISPTIVLTPGQLAQIAVAKLTMHGPAIGSAPKKNGSGLVGMPVWLWTDQTPQTWGPQSATAAIPGLSVTATATATAITWDMGDGHQVTCANPGTPYVPADGSSASPDCGYTYTTPSGGQPNGEFTITGTTAWQVSWVASTGEKGTVPPITTKSTTTVKIGEMQAVNH